MPHYDHLVIGSGMAAAAAVEAIRGIRPRDSIGMIGSEAHLPYNRPPLSKGLWKGQTEDSIFRGIKKLNVALHPGKRATALNLAAKQLTDESDGTYTYGKLLIATGGTPHQLPDAPDGVIYFRTLDDYRNLRHAAHPGSDAAVIGGGFIGWEVAAALASNGVQTTMIFPEAGIGTRIYPPALSEFIGNYYRGRGVELLVGESVTAIEKADGKFVLHTASGKTVEKYILVAGIGITPNVELAESAGLRVDNGIVVDRHLQSSVPDVYAAGDVANFYNPALGNRLRVEHEDNANTMGAAAGKNMAGEPTPYDHLPFFYSDLFDLGYEAVGELDSRLEMVEDWKQPFEEGVVYYLKAGRVRGVLLWNTWGQIENARHLIATPGPWSERELRGRLPE